MYDWEEDGGVSDEPAVITNIIVTGMSQHYSRSAASNSIISLLLLICMHFLFSYSSIQIVAVPTTTAVHMLTTSSAVGTVVSTTVISLHSNNNVNSSKQKQKL